MKGYVLVILANGILFLAVGAMALGNGLWIRGHGETCPTGNVTRCDRDRSISQTTLRVAPFLATFGALLCGVGASLWLWHRWFRPPPIDVDEGPGYP